MGIEAMAESKKSAIQHIRVIFMVFGRIAAPMGIICCSILIITACIGIFRGYSVQSRMMDWLVTVAMVCIVFYWGLGSFKPSIIWLCCSVIILYMSISSLQSSHYLKGLKLYYEGCYGDAVIEFEKETDLWYLKLSPNSSEPVAMHMLAKSYCQLEEFSKARDIYELGFSRYQGTVHGQSAAANLNSLKIGLGIISEYIEDSPKRQDDYKKLYVEASAYELNLSCYKKAVEVYKKITEMSIPAENKSRAHAAIKRLMPIEHKR